jgi:hypothetical protein
MGAKIVLSGEAQNIHQEGSVVSFTIDTGPATRKPPQGLKLYGRTRYRVECTAEQWQRAYQDQNQHSAVIVEGYLEPRQEEGTGQLYVAVTATVLQSALAHSRRRLKRLEKALNEARAAFKTTRDSGASQVELEAKASAFIKANEAVNRFLERHPDLRPASPRDAGQQAADSSPEGKD